MAKGNIKEVLFDLTESGYNKETKLDNFFDIVKEVLKEKNEIMLPIHLFELIFEFDFHKNGRQPILDIFREHGFGVRKVYNKYLVKIYLSNTH